MRAPFAALLLVIPATGAVVALASCAGPTAQREERSLASPTERALPEGNPSDLRTPRATTLLPPTGEIAVRVRRGPAGQPVIMEFLSAGLTEEDRVRLRTALEAGRLRLASEPAKGEESWTTTLRQP